MIYIITTCNDEKSTPEDKNIEENITEDVRNLFRTEKLQKGTIYTTIKYWN